MKRKIMIFLVSTLFIFSFCSISSVASDENTQPYPPLVEGPSSGQIKVSYDYYITITDPDYGDFMWTLEIDFGDELVTYGGPGCGQTWQNGTVIVVSHKWFSTGDFEVKARVMDSFDEWSEWSDPIFVSLPKSKINIEGNFFQADLGLHGESEELFEIDGQYKNFRNIHILFGKAILTNSDRSFGIKGVLKRNIFLFQTVFRSRIVNIFGKFTDFNEENQIYNGEWRGFIKGIGSTSGWIKASF